MARIEARPLDEALCSRYCLNLLDLHKRLDEIDDTIKTINNSEQGTLQNMGRSVQGSLQNMETSILGTLNNIDTSLQELLYYARRGMACKCFTERNNNQDSRLFIRRKSHQLGQCKFTLYQQIDLTSVAGDENRRVLSDLVMMDDARLVICLSFQCRLLICNTDGSQIDSINLQGNPCCVTPVNITTVAVTLGYVNSIDMYDINNKLKLKSISVHEICYKGITTLTNKLVVCGANRLLFKDHHTGELVRTTQTDCYPSMLYNSGDRIFYFSSNNNDNKLSWYSYTDDKHYTKTLPSKPSWMTTLQDSSMYVVCIGGSVQHVSSDGKQHENVTGLCLGNDNVLISYNGKQNKLVTINKVQRFARGVAVQIFKEV